MIKRKLLNELNSRLFKGKIILLFGPRQVGKTTLVQTLLADRPEKSLQLTADAINVRDVFSSTNLEVMKLAIGQHNVLFIDEAQRIDNIGLSLKLLTDAMPSLQIIATGSSAFELANNLNEPLTGRKFVYELFPLSYQERVDEYGWLTEKETLEQRLVLGSYPDVVTAEAGLKEEVLDQLAGSYLYKDILMLDAIRKPTLLDKLVRALALQVGSEVSFQELARLTGTSHQTVIRYIDLLEQSYVIFRLPAFSRNLRTEIRKGQKIYFYDNGIRNAVLGNYTPLASRTDVGALWENYLISERLKHLRYTKQRCHQYFWRTTHKQEIDYLEECAQDLSAWEFKWNPKAKVKIAKPFLAAYPDTSINVINRENFDSFLGL